MEQNPATFRDPGVVYLARVVLSSFLVTFIASRILVFLIIANKLPDLYLYLGETHIHHLNYGIFLLSIIGAYVIFIRPQGKALEWSALIYGVGLGMTFDEFGMWLHLGGSYWQRASFDAAIVITALLALIAFSPSIKKWRSKHFGFAGVLLIIVSIFFIMLIGTLGNRGAKKIAPHLKQLESQYHK